MMHHDASVDPPPPGTASDERQRMPGATAERRFVPRMVPGFKLRFVACLRTAGPTPPSIEHWTAGPGGDSPGICLVARSCPSRKDKMDKICPSRKDKMDKTCPSRKDKIW
jgi:hypothetical protein